MLLVSDIHFGANRTQDIEGFLATALHPEMNPDHTVIIAGDITQTSAPQEFQQSEQFIDRLLQAGIKVLLTPGNHDLGNWPGELIRTDPEAKARFLQLLQPVFAQPEIITTRDFDAIARINQDVYVVLRSTHRGELQHLGVFGHNRIDKKQIQWAVSNLASIQLRGLRLHLVSHRSLWHESGDSHTGMVKRRRLERALFQKYSFYSFIHGHNHRFVYAHTTTPKLGIPIIRVGLPTLSTRNKKWQAGYVRWDPPFDQAPQLIKRANSK